MLSEATEEHEHAYDYLLDIWKDLKTSIEKVLEPIETTLRKQKQEEENAKKLQEIAAAEKERKENEQAEIETQKANEATRIADAAAEVEEHRQELEAAYSEAVKFVQKEAPWYWEPMAWHHSAKSKLQELSKTVGPCKTKHSDAMEKDKCPTCRNEMLKDALSSSDGCCWLFNLVALAGMLVVYWHNQMMRSSAEDDDDPMDPSTWDQDSDSNPFLRVAFFLGCLPRPFGHLAVGAYFALVLCYVLIMEWGAAETFAVALCVSAGGLWLRDFSQRWALQDHRVIYKTYPAAE